MLGFTLERHQVHQNHAHSGTAATPACQSAADSIRPLAAIGKLCDSFNGHVVNVVNRRPTAGYNTISCLRIGTPNAIAMCIAIFPVTGHL